jgi:PAS domain S-box-containing protein
MVTSINSEREVSCRVTSSVLKYLEFKGYNLDFITAGLPYSREYLSDPLNWVTYETRDTLCRRAAELTSDDAIMIQVGLSALELNPLGGVESMVRLLTGPKTVYKYMPKYASLFDRVFKFRTTFNGRNRATIEMSAEGRYYLPSKDSCYYAQGILAALPTLWGLPPADVCEKKCMCKPEHGIIEDDIQYEAEACVYEVEWQPLHSWYQRLRDNLMGQIFPVAANVKELEQNFRHIDRENTELAERNKQLAAVREIAISVDGVRTIDEALSLAVEQARDIEGVRFVFVQKMDETGEFVITPYYSKIRNHFVANAIKAVGFDAEKELGDNPSSKKLLRFPFSKLKVAQDYMRNPRVMVISSIAELLDGVWARTLCDSIQKIMGVKKVVIVPLMVKGESWGTMLYYLDKELPIDILEMIAAHCALAIKNILTLNNLELRNQELSAIQEKLSESEERYRTIFESANDILILINNKGKILDVNARIIDTGGYEPEEVIGKDFRTLSRIMTKKSIAIVAKNYLKRMAGLTVSPYEVEMVTQNGERKTVEINAVAVRKSGRIIGDLAILRDITERKQAEKNLKLQNDLIDRILATIPNAVLLLNKNLKVIMANRTFYDLFRLKKKDVENKSVRELIVSSDLDEAIITMLNGKETKASTEFRYSIASSEKVLLASIFAMKEENLLLVINDVTEERRRQERLYLTDRLASVGEMASGIAHELNNPLTGIIGLSDLITKQEMPDDVKEDLMAINSEAQRCASIVKNLLAFARKHTQKREPVQVMKIVEDVLHIRAYEQKAQNITVDTQFPPSLSDVLADYFQIQQVFLNIILNAETAMIDANGRGVLKITGEQADGHIRVSFSDDGPGISKENLRNIFNPFFTTKEVGKGTGLGLSICYGIVASHGGRIYAKSENGKGATFVVELPALDDWSG